MTWPQLPTTAGGGDGIGSRAVTAASALRASSEMGMPENELRHRATTSASSSTLRSDDTSSPECGLQKLGY